MQRTLAFALVSGLAASASFADLTSGVPSGGAYLQADQAYEEHFFGMPANETYSLAAPPSGAGSASTVVKVLSTGDASSVTFDFDITTSGIAGAFGGADVVVEFDLASAVNFTLDGQLGGLTFFQSWIEGLDNPASVFDDLTDDGNGSFFGSLVDDQGDPMSSFQRAGLLGAGSYRLTFSSFSEALPGAGAFDGAGHLSLTLAAVPAPSAALALGAPALLGLRRRRR